MGCVYLQYCTKCTFIFEVVCFSAYYDEKQTPVTAAQSLPAIQIRNIYYKHCMHYVIISHVIPQLELFVKGGLSKIFCPSDFNEPEDAGMEPRTVGTFGLAVRVQMRSLISNAPISHPRSTISHHTRLSLIHIRFLSHSQTISHPHRGLYNVFQNSFRNSNVCHVETCFIARIPM